MKRIRFETWHLLALTFMVAFFLSLARLAATHSHMSDIATNAFGMAPFLSFLAACCYCGDEIHKTAIPVAATLPVLLVAAVLYSYRVGGEIGVLPALVVTGIVWSAQYIAIFGLTWWLSRR